MFFSVDQINKILECPHCLKKFDDPRFLPCGFSMCNDCILTIENKKAHLTCTFCNETHRSPKEGFPQNKILMKFLEAHPDEIYRGKIADNLRSVLTDIKSKLDDLNRYMQCGNEKIRDYCNNLRNEIEMVTKDAVEHLNKNKEELINKINFYEQDCVENFEKKQDYKRKFGGSMEDIEKFHNEWHDYLQGLSLDDEKMQDAIRMARNHLFNIKNEEDCLKEFVFNGKMLDFQQDYIDKDKNLLGSVYSSMIVPLFGNFDKLRRLDLSKIIPGYNVYKLAIDCLENGNFILFLVNSPQKHLNIYILDKYGKIITEKVGFFDTQSCWDAKITLINNKIIAYVSFCTGNYTANSTRYRFLLSCLSNDLFIEKNLKLSSNLTFLSSNSKNIFCFTSQEILIYNMDFDLEGKIELILNDHLSHHIQNINLITQVKVNDENYFILYDDKMIIWSIENKSMVKVFPIDGDNFALYLNSFLISINNSKAELFYYDLGGNVINQQRIDNLNLKLNLLNDEKDNICFYDKNGSCLFVK